MKTKVRAVDFDGTLVHYEGWKGHRHVGKPVPHMVERVKKWITDGDDVFILTARLTPWDEAPPVGQTIPEEAKRIVEDWCEKHLDRRLHVTNIKGGFDALYDDNVVQIVQNTGLSLQEHIINILRDAVLESVCKQETYATSLIIKLIDQIEGLQNE